MSIIALSLASLFLSPFQGMPAGDPLKWVNDQGKWKQVGAALMAKAPAAVRNGTTYTKFKYLYGEYIDLLIKSGAPLNYSGGGRVSFGFESWTCGSHAKMIEGLFNGASVKDVKFVYLATSVEGATETLKKGVNSNHGTMAAVIDGLPITFDPWLPAYLTTKTYSNRLELEFGGLPYQIWEMVVKKEGYTVFATHDSADGTAVWRKTAKAALEDLNMIGKDPPSPPALSRAVNGGHWRLERISAFTDNLPRYGPNSCAAAALDNMYWSWVYENGSNLMFSKLTLNVQPSISFLTPGKSSVVGTLIQDKMTSGSNSGWVDFMCSYTGKSSYKTDQAHHYAGIDRTGALFPDQAGPYTPTLNVVIDIPSGSPGEEFRLILSSEAGGVHYIYKWSGSGSVPAVVAEKSFGGRWKTEWGNIELKVKDRHVEGTYPHDSGRLVGDISLDGITLKGKWSEAPTFAPPNDAGDFEFILSDDGKSFKGRYWYGTRKASDPGKAWTGTKIE